MGYVGWATGRWPSALSCFLSFWLSLSISALAGPTARISESGEAVELEIPGGIETIPLHRVGQVRYFSAGVGIEERSATYPSFPLKLVFTAGGKPYVAGVSVTLQRARRTIVTIPPEHVTGPWLFVDAPEGAYHIAATMDEQTEHLGDVKVEKGKQKTVYLRWPEDRRHPREGGFDSGRDDDR